MLVISNSSPLIILCKCDLLGLLKHFFGEILIPQAVYDEVVHQAKDREQSAAIMSCDFIRVHSSSIEGITFSRKLDRGEQEALMLAVALHADFILLDDKRAQKEALALNLSFLPTFALIVKAARKGVVADLDAVLAQLQEKNIFLSRELSLAAHTFVELS